MNPKELILSFITKYITSHGYPPSYSEIMEGTGYKSKSTVHGHITKMIELGMLETDTDPGAPRALRVPGMVFVKREE
jgi:repressor LexA